MSPRLGTYEKVQERFLGFWQRREEFGAPVGCLATSFTFDGGFFEEECLARFVGMEADAAEDELSYLIEREERLAGVYACVLVDRQHVAARRSLRWRHLPVTVPGGGILHAKISLLAWRDRVRLLVGSANLTEPGYRRNIENVAQLDFPPEGDLPREILEEAIAFLGKILEWTPGSATGRGETRKGAATFLKTVRQMSAEWHGGRWKAEEPKAVFIPVAPGRPSLFQRLKDARRANAPYSATVVSPFFETGARAIEVLSGLVNTMERGDDDRTVDFVVSGNELPNGEVELNAPAEYESTSIRRLQTSFSLVDHLETGEHRPLHAKSLMLDSLDETIYTVGSSNFTLAGSGLGRSPNAEANVAYLVPAGARAFRDLCEASRPPIADLRKRKLTFVETGPDEEMDVSGFVPLPRKFGEALFDPAELGGELRLEIGPGEPSEFEILDDEGNALPKGPADDDGTLRASWSKPRPPSSLRVRWRTDGSGHREAIWVVNVTDSSKLPPPAELRGLSLDELVLILSSARPIHEILASMRRQRLAREPRRVGAGARDVELDPHKRVDTSGYLLKRVRRVSQALEGLRDRLGRPVMSLEGLRWRLRGPVGPLALAQQVAVGEGATAAFLIAEIGLTLRQIHWGEAERVLGRANVAKEVRSVLGELRTMADSCPTEEAVAGYVRESFEEVLA